MGEAAAIPLALLVVAALQLALAPAQTWISRRMEAEADWKALQTTRDPAAARGLFVGFGDTSLANPDPPGWAHVLLDSHPTLAQRVAMAAAWKQRNYRSREPGARRTAGCACRYVSVYSGPEPPSGGVSRPPRAVIAPHWTQFDGVSLSSTRPSPTSSPTS